MGGLTKRKFFSHSSRGWKSGIRVPAWSGSGESSLTGLQTATSLLCAHMEERETRSSLMYLFFLTHPMACAEKAMAPHSSTLAWRIPWTEEPGGLRSMGLLGVRHD